MVKIYARLCEKNEYNYIDDIENSSKKSVKKLAIAVKEQIEADGYTINTDGTCSKADNGN